MRARFSLLVPGTLAARLPRADFLLFAALYALAVAARWGLRDVHPYTAEATHFVVAKGLWHSTTNIRYADFIGGYDDYSWFFWQRPLLTLPFWPAAQHSFLAYRTAHLLVVAAAPALGAWLLRSLGVGRLPAGGAAAVLAVHPLLLPWAVLVLPDSLMLTGTLGALLLAHHGRPAATALVLLATSWVKEVTFVTSLTLLVLALWRDADGTTWLRRHQPAMESKETKEDRPFAEFRGVRGSPGQAGQATKSAKPRESTASMDSVAGGSRWRLGPFARWLAPVVPLAFLPLIVSLQVDGVAFPGFRPGGDEALMYETLWLAIWLAPLPLLALLSPRTRRLALVAMAWPAFFLLYHYGRDKAIESWYNVVPASLTLLATAAGISTLWQARGRLRWAAPALGLAVACLMSVQVLVPDSHSLNADVVTPLSHRGQWDYAQARAAELRRDDDLAAVLAAPSADERGTWIALDLDWSLIMHPVAGHADEVVKMYSNTAPLEEGVVRGWAEALETLVDATVVFHRDDVPINLATRQAYSECALSVGQYTVIQADRCKGHGGDLWDLYQAAVADAGQA